MRVRGAPAIAIVAALSLAVELRQRTFASAQEAAAFVKERLAYLRTSRPTAVNLFEMAARFEAVADQAAAASADGAAAGVVNATVAAAEAMMAADIADNRAIGAHGAADILRGKAADQRVKVLTHCNTGSLATAQYGTALGVIRSLHEQGRLEHAFCTETRPYNQVGEGWGGGRISHCDCSL